MSLKTFHLVFLIASEILAIFLAVFCVSNFRRSGDAGQLGWGALSALVAIVLLFYGRYFLRKLKHVSYL